MFLENPKAHYKKGKFYSKSVQYNKMYFTKNTLKIYGMQILIIVTMTNGNYWGRAARMLPFALTPHR